jgi:branched-chain amino acid aminotransferase
MVNFNGDLQTTTPMALHENRGFLYGDGVFETIKVAHGKVLFLEDHYFRLMATMRIVRMKIPMNFTLEFFEAELLKTVAANSCADAARVRCTVFRNAGGYYLPETNTVSYLMQATALSAAAYVLSTAPYEVDLYKDFYITKHLLSTLKTTNKMLHITGSIFAQENGLQTCLLLNNDKNVVEALHGNLFMRTGTTVITPPLSEGCLNGIMRKQLLRILQKQNIYTLVEQPISPFDLQKADELFVTNVIRGIQPITTYRKKTYTNELAECLLSDLNTLF